MKKRPSKPSLYLQPRVTSNPCNDQPTLFMIMSKLSLVIFEYDLVVMRVNLVEAQFSNSDFVFLILLDSTTKIEMLGLAKLPTRQVSRLRGLAAICISPDSKLQTNKAC
jgi:hypothetical protein